MSSAEDRQVPLGQHPPVRVSCTWVGEVLLAAGKPNPSRRHGY